MSPLVHALIRKFVALQLAVEIMHGPSLASHTNLPQARIAFSITHSDTESDPRWGWLGMACETSIDLTTAALPTNRDEMHLVRVRFIGASLSEPHTSVTALRTCVCM